MIPFSGCRDGLFEVFEHGELHGCEGEVASRQCAVASPQLAGFVEFFEGLDGCVAGDGFGGGAGGGRGFLDHLRILLEDFCRREDTAGD